MVVKVKRLVILLLICILVTQALIGPLFAVSDIEKKMQELKEINEAIAKYERLYEQKRSEEKRVLNEINKIDKNIDTLEEDINKLQVDLQATEVLINVIKEDIEIATARVEERADYFNTRLKEIYIHGDVSFLEVLLQATDFTDFLTRFDLLERIAQNDVRLLRELDILRNTLYLKKQELESKAEHFNNLKGQKENKRRQLEIQSRQKSNYLITVQEQKAEYKKASDELEEVRINIDAFIKEWQQAHPETYMGCGKMGWPIPGHSYISSKFGYRIHPIWKTRSFHYGIDIPAPKGTKVVASERGRVVFVGNKVAYGKAIIIDHGGGISTQYSHLWKAYVTLGEEVQKGQAIGAVDSTGWSTGNHLDYIVRVNGTPKDPLDYVSPE